MALVEMKRLRAVVLQSRRRSLLRQLRREGCVEVETAQESTDFEQENVLENTVAENTGAREYMDSITQALEVLGRYVPPPGRSLLAGKPKVTQQQLYDEKVLDEAVFLKEGRLVRHSSVDEIRETEGKSVDHLFREIFAVQGSGNGSGDGDR